MGQQYICPECGIEVVLVDSGGVHREILCNECNRELDVDGRTEVEWVGIEDENDDYKIANNE